MSDLPPRSFAFFLIPILGLLLSVFGTHHGAGYSRDSLRYLRGAENIAHGNGYTDIGESGALESITHWPPLYSMVLAVPIAMGLSTQNAVRVVNSLAFFATIALVGVLVRRLTSSQRVAMATMAVVMLVPAIVHNHLMAWSETLFIPLILAGLVKMLDYAEHERWVDLGVAGLCIGISAVTRYAGVAFIAGIAGALIMWDWRARPLRAFQAVFAFAAVAGLPMGIWFARNVLATQHAHDRPLEAHDIGVEKVRVGLNAITQWLLPDWFNLRVRTVWLMLVVVLLVLAWRRSSKVFAPDPLLRRFLLLAAMCVASYLAFVFMTMRLFDFEVNFDIRMMAPVFVLAAIAFAAVAPARFARPWPRVTRVLALALAISFALLASYSILHAWAAHREPAQFAGPRWQNAGAWERVKSAPADTPIFSAQPEVSQYFTGRGVRELPKRGQPPVPCLVLHYPTLDGADASLARIAALHARALDSGDVVVVYAVER